MPLDTLTKTVLFHDGPFDEVDRFLLPAPATDYIENLHFHKQGNLQKRAGNSLLTTVPNANGDPIFLHSIKDSLYTLTEDGARSFVNGAWQELDVPGFIATKKMDVETPPVGGMGHIDFLATTVGTDLYYTVVYEVREKSSSQNSTGAQAATPKHVVVQSYNAQGEFLFQKRIANARSPKVVAHANATLRTAGTTQVFYQDEATNKIHGQAFFPSTGFLTPPLITEIVCSEFYALESIAIRSQGQPMYFTRLGASSDGIARYHVATQTSFNQYVFLVQDAGTIWGYVLSSTLALVNVELIRTSTGPGVGTIENEALDVAVEGSLVLLMWTEFDTTAPTYLSNVVIARYNSGLTSQLWRQTVLSPTKRTFTHGGLAIDGAKAAWMVHDAGLSGYEPTGAGVNSFVDTDAVRDPDTGLTYDIINPGTGLTVGPGPRPLVHHRMASRPLFFDGKLYCAVQQWADYTQREKDGPNYKSFVGVIGATKPKTTVLACFDHDNNRVQPVAYVDAGQSKTCEYAESEFAVHNPHLQLESGSLLLANRLVLQAEDLSMYFGTLPGPDAILLRLGNQESPAAAQCRIHRIIKGPDPDTPLRSAFFGDGIVTSTAVPLWYDGKFFGEFGPIDAPEIIRFVDSRMVETSETTPQGFNPEGEGPADGWRKIQIIVGYYDGKGNKHRSEPSSINYVQFIDPDDASGTFDGGGFPINWRGKDCTVYFTWPLSMLPADLEYFVELYASDGPDDDPRLVDVNSCPLGTAPAFGTDVKVDFQLIRWTVGASPAFGNPPRTSATVYTAGGELPASPWPAFTASVVTSTRFFALDAVNKGKVLVSKRFEDFVAPEYNALLDINLGDERSLLCIEKLDDKTIIFEKDDIHVIYGDGPLNNGQGEDFAIHYISTDVGCEDQESIVECPTGLVFFRRERGFYLLDRQLNIKYIGDRVHDLSKGIDVVAAELVSADSQVRFLCEVTGTQQDPDGLDPGAGQERPPRPVYGNRPPRPLFIEQASRFALVWDYEKDQWSVFTNYPGEASAIHQGQYTRLLANWDIWQERSNTDQDFTDPPPLGSNRLLLRTPWIPLENTTQSYSRLHRMNILGRYLSTLSEYESGDFDACDIQVKVWYDYEEGPDVTPQTKLFKYQDFGFNPFSKRNIRAERLQFAITPAEGRGRTQAVKLEFEERVPADLPNGQTHALGQGFEISAIDFEIGTDSRVTRQLPMAVVK